VGRAARGHPSLAGLAAQGRPTLVQSVALAVQSVALAVQSVGLAARGCLGLVGRAARGCPSLVG
jgi:hypothetical protein